MCPSCQNYYPDKEVLRSHKKHSHDRALQPKTIKCKYCSKELPDHDAFYRHANTAHLVNEMFFLAMMLYIYSYSFLSTVSYEISGLGDSAKNQSRSRPKVSIFCPLTFFIIEQFTINKVLTTVGINNQIFFRWVCSASGSFA